jgi:hypothetical protein
MGILDNQCLYDRYELNIIAYVTYGMSIDSLMHCKPRYTLVSYNAKAPQIREEDFADDQRQEKLQ